MSLSAAIALPRPSKTLHTDIFWGNEFFGSLHFMVSIARQEITLEKPGFVVCVCTCNWWGWPLHRKFGRSSSVSLHTIYAMRFWPLHQESLANYWCNDIGGGCTEDQMCLNLLSTVSTVDVDLQEQAIKTHLKIWRYGRQEQHCVSVCLLEAPQHQTIKVPEYGSDKKCDSWVCFLQGNPNGGLANGGLARKGANWAKKRPLRGNFCSSPALKRPQLTPKRPDFQEGFPPLIFSENLGLSPRLDFPHSWSLDAQIASDSNPTC